MPVYVKPMIDSTLMQAGISEILIISTPHDLQKLLGDGARICCKFSYAMQEKPNGLAQAFLNGEEFIGTNGVALILGDNIFHSDSITSLLPKIKNPERGVVFAYQVSDSERYGVVEFDKNFKVIWIDEKPDQPKSHFAVSGLSFYNNSVVEIAKNIKPMMKSGYGEYSLSMIA